MTCGWTVFRPFFRTLPSSDCAETSRHTTFMMNFGGKLPVFTIFCQFLKNPPMFKRLRKISEKRTLVKRTLGPKSTRNVFICIDKTNNRLGAFLAKSGILCLKIVFFQQWLSFWSQDWDYLKMAGNRYAGPLTHEPEDHDNCLASTSNRNYAVSRAIVTRSPLRAPGHYKIRVFGNQIWHRWKIFDPNCSHNQWSNKQQINAMSITFQINQNSENFTPWKIRSSQWILLGYMALPGVKGLNW